VGAIPIRVSNISEYRKYGKRFLAGVADDTEQIPCSDAKRFSSSHKFPFTSYPQPNNPLYTQFPLRQFWFFHLPLGLTSGLPTQISWSNLCIDFSPPSVPHTPPISSSLIDHPCVSGEEYKPRSTYVYSCIRPIVTSSLLDKIFPSAPCYPTHSAFFSLRDITSFTPT
jgi:hypothetical protein